MIQSLFFIVSILLILLAPNSYSYEFCLLIHWLYIILAVYNLYLIRKYGYIGFTMFFSLAFYFVNFVYPVFYYPTNPHFSLFVYAFNENLISYCTTVAFCAYASFSFGLRKFFAKHKIIVYGGHPPIINMCLNARLIKILYFIFLCVLIVFLFNGGTNYFTHQFSGTSNMEDVESGYIFALLQAIIYPLLILVLIYPQKKSSIFLIPFITIVCTIIIIILTGSRTLPMALVIIIVTLYNDCIKRIKLITFFSGLVCGILFLSIVGALRGSGNMIELDSLQQSGNIINDKQADIFSFANELIINNRSLYSLIGYAQENTYTFGVTLLGGILNIVPFLHSTFCNLTGIHPDFLGSATFNTFLESGHYRHQGLGTNAVSDIYLAFGIIGVVVGFYALGYIINWLQYNKFKSINYCLAYYIMVSGAVYSCRSSFLGNIRPIIWSIIIVWFISHIISKSKKKTVHNN